MNKIFILFKPIYCLLDLVIPKKNFAIFCSQMGMGEGNTVVLYNYFKEKLPDTIFFKKSNSLKSLWTSLRAKTVIMSHGPGDIPYAWHSFRKNVVYLGHGITIKKMLFEDENLSLKRRIISGLESRFYSHVIASSEKDAQNLSKVFRLPLGRIQVTGLPRNDVFKSGNKDVRKLWGDGKYILYAPTYRPEVGTLLFPFRDKDLHGLNEKLKKSNVFIVVRTHPNDIGDNQRIFDHSNILSGNILELKNIQPYLFSFNGLITDYSSIYIDYLLSNKKVGFIPYDLESYKKSTGLFFEYGEVTPGPKISSQGELESFLFSGLDQFEDERERVKKVFYKYHDFNACKRIFNLLK